jgi:hypothetical protein
VMNRLHGPPGPPCPLPYCFSSFWGSTMNFTIDLLRAGSG